ncbi:membrane protein [Roseivivax isoporae LMG 25204]|uniref:Membrane protein n=1 Tax=Roseivivax isoporae LMG 25204 TaxID=1449351 RepID=X7FF34_9RHOB|nr:membrane protein [Roseivivax isoporae LMG 25204]
MLIGGLVTGVALPDLAAWLAPALVPTLAAMLCVAALREGPRAALPRRGAFGPALAATLVLQLALPLAAGAAFWTAGVLGQPVVTGMLLALAAAPITGAPGLAVMTGADAGATLRHLTLGTALLPFTAAPVFALLPVFPDPFAVLAGALRLLLLVGLAALVAAGLRAAVPAVTRPAARPALDGLMAIGMALVVVGLMSAVAPAAAGTPLVLAVTLALAFALHLAQTLGGWHAARRTLPRPEAQAVAIVAANRNLALFLAAVPSEVAAPLMVFVGCYQIPMYLTPLMLPRLTTARAA